MSIRNLELLLRPRSVAVVGASDKPSSVGRMVLGNIVAGGFRGAVYPINPKYAVLNGLKCYPSANDLPETPDLAIITSPPDTVPQLIAELGRQGTRAAVVITAGFGEGGTVEGQRRRQAALDAAKPYCVRIMGPNCFGLVLPELGLNASFARTAAATGKLAFVTQSGAIMAAMMDWAQPRQVGFSAIMSLGDMIDVDFGDALDYLAEDAATGAILLYIEAITHPRKFMSAARAAARMKPVIVIKGGRHAAAAKAAASHTGALAGVDAVYDAAFARAGLLRVRTLEQLFDTAALLSVAPVPQGDRVAIVTNGGGLGVLAVDDLLDRRGELAALTETTMQNLNASLPVTWSHGNPIDIIGDADGPRYASAVRGAVADENVDAVLVMHCPTAVADPMDAANAVIGTAAACKKPILTAWLGEASALSARRAFAQAGLPTFASADEAIDGFINLTEYRKRRDMLMEVPKAVPAVSDEHVAEARALIGNVQRSGGGWLSSLDARRLLDLYGIPVNRSVFAPSATTAAEAAEAMGTAVALKVSSRDIVHKSDVGGVILNLNGRDAVKAAGESMIRRIQQVRPGTMIDGFTVEAMVDRPQAIELILGLTVDSTFGPVVIFGQGGTAVEVVNDKALGLPPLNTNLAHMMIDGTRVARLMAGYRDRPAVDVDSVPRALVALAQIAIDHPGVTDIDINPLLADVRGIIAVDARVKVASESAISANRLIISPYPHQLERDGSLRDGSAIFLRPVRPEDEDILRAMFHQLTPEDVRLRFFTQLRELDPSMAARLTQIDYDRQMAILALPDRRPGTAPWGIGRIHADPDNVAAEFAVTVRSDCQGRGVGRLLLGALLDIAARRGIGKVWGNVMQENTRMLRLCEAMGFQREPANDATLVRVSIGPGG